MRPARLLLPMLLLLAMPVPAHAYIDPNIGGQLAQVLAPIVTMIIGVLAFARQWLKAQFARIADRARALVSRVRG
jgi:hypothetical protein